MNAAKKPETPPSEPARSRLGGDSLGALFDALQAEVDHAVRAALGALFPAWEALSAYEAALRAELVADWVGRLAGVAGVVAPARSRRDLAPVRALALDALRGALAEAEDEAPPDDTLDVVESGIVEAPTPEDDPSPAATAAPTPAAVPPPSTGRPLTRDEIREQLAARLGSSPTPVLPPRSTPAARVDRDAEPRALVALLERAGTPPDLTLGAAAIDDEVDLLDRLSSPGEHAAWDELGVGAVTDWLAMLVARSRAARDAVDPRSRAYRVYREAINRLPTYAKTRPTGFVNGMSPKHAPLRGSWRIDALHHLEALRQTLARHQDVDPSPPARPTPTPPRDTSRIEREVIDWPHRARAADLSVLLFGGSPREDVRAHVERALGLGELEWPDSDKPRKLDSLVERIRAGKIDVVLIVTSFVSHKESNRLVEAVRASDVPYAHVRGGYGLDAVRRALEEALGGGRRAD